MPKIHVNGLDINYKIYGEGDPLLMIMGLSFSLLDWGTELPELLSRHYKVILFDNRDAGETSQAAGTYTTAQMAEDAANLLKMLGETKAHVFGISMGGMVAQQFALNHTDQLKKLILGCTMAGGTCSQFNPPAGLGSSSILEQLFPLGFLQAHQSRIGEFLQATAPYHSQGEALIRQYQAMSTHDACSLLGKIMAPTLVITGDSDRIIPPQNSEFLAKNIPGAKLEVLTEAGHAFCFSHPETTAAAIISFLQS
ncbi:alpha/beta fold hydrolase [Trichocoleus sp. FACHB-262]|uniref:alpha/beta fold hydrolase n=1 Tax=Trichocoleus sp. FACHB-262 TaxID=2692869 RepID=UPI001687D503|nr:alpha/beta fold hydrolase [Trichocoleus sp. FACHB-262]MBD2121136.1 alpha/beta fold hydrolase [Trichocoleus sp. FACHB-262]